MAAGTQPHKRGRKVWQHRIRAILWMVMGAVSFVFGWQSSVVLVWIASVYANSSTDWGNGEAADDTTVLDAIADLASDVASMRAEVGELRELVTADGS